MNKPYYLAINSDGLWWDGKVWRKWSENPAYDYHRINERKFMDDLFNRHPDGVFECPRCRMPHNLPDNFDYLCDGCVWTLSAPGNPNRATQEMLDGIAEWSAYKKQAPWGSHPKIVERIRERQTLSDANSYEMVIK